MIVDTNVHLSHWPFRRVHGDEPEQLVELLQGHDITQAWAANIEGMLHEDIAGVNERLAAWCGEHEDLLVPFGTVNPALPDWEEDLRRVHEDHGMAGIRLYPNYQGFALDGSAAEKLSRAAAERGLVVQVAEKMQDERVHHPLMKVPPTDLGPLAELKRKIPDLKVMAINALRSTGGVKELADAGVVFDIGMLEGVAAVEKLVERVGKEAVLFGSHAPLFYIDSALLKMRAAELAPAQSAAVLHENATALLEG